MITVGRQEPRVVTVARCSMMLSVILISVILISVILISVISGLPGKTTMAENRALKKEKRYLRLS